MDYLDNNHHKRGKINVMNYDKLAAVENDRCLYCLSTRDIMIILAQLEYAQWPTRYFSPSGTPIDPDTIQAWYMSIQEELMADHCDIDTAINNILTQITVINENTLEINNNLTVINENIVTINTDIETVNNNLVEINTDITNISIQNNYLNVITIINNLWTYATSSTDKTNTALYARYNGFCLSILAWMASALQAYANSLSYSSLFTAVISGLLSHYGLPAIPQGTPTTPSGSPVTEGDATAAFTDFTAVNDVACVLISALINQVPSASTFAAALNGYTPPAYPDHRRIITDILLASITLSQSFNSWASISDYYFQQALAANPTDYQCAACLTSPTDWCTIPETWDFTVPQLLPWNINRGVLTVGKGIVGVTDPTDVSNYTYDVRIYFNSAGCIFNSPNKLNFYTTVKPGTTGQFIIEYFTAPTQVIPTQVTFTTSGNAQIIPWTLNGHYYKYIRAYPVTNGGYFGFVSLAQATYAVLTKVTLTAS